MLSKLAFVKNATLTTHNWQNWERVLFSCYCHGINKVEVVGLKNRIILKKKKKKSLQFFMNMWNLGKFLEKSIFCR